MSRLDFEAPWFEIAPPPIFPSSLRPLAQRQPNILYTIAAAHSARSHCWLRMGRPPTRKPCLQLTFYATWLQMRACMLFTLAMRNLYNSQSVASAGSRI
jgi:hypothetical protein